MRSVAVIQARMGSSRLPGKVLMPLAGKAVLWHVVTRVLAAKNVADVIVATSTQPADDAIEAFCKNNGWHCVRGSETDVLSRYAMAAQVADADIIIRVTSDCPLFSPLILDAMLDQFDPAIMDYLSTNYPTRSFPVGLDSEIMSAKMLLQIADQATAPYDREHVTPYFYQNPDKFKIKGFACDEDLQDIRITLDTQQDYDRLVNLIAAHPELTDPMVDVVAVTKPYFKGPDHHGKT